VDLAWIPTRYSDPLFRNLTTIPICIFTNLKLAAASKGTVKPEVATGKHIYKSIHHASNSC
jgi:hypothetical protein